jgi:hypothetical protein
MQRGVIDNRRQQVRHEHQGRCNCAAAAKDRRHSSPARFCVVVPGWTSVYYIILPVEISIAIRK